MGNQNQPQRQNQNQNQPQRQNQNQNQPQNTYRSNDTLKSNYDILTSNVNVEPSGVVYNIKGSTVEDFVINYLESRGVNGVSNVKVTIRNEGRDQFSVALYAFLSKNSNAVLSHEHNVPPMLKNKVDKVNVRLSDDAKKILVPVAGQEYSAGKAERGEFYIKLNIFLVLGLMFSAIQGRHQLAIASASTIPASKDCILSVFKTYSYPSQGSGPRDNYSKQIEYLERNSRHK